MAVVPALAALILGGTPALASSLPGAVSVTPSPFAGCSSVTPPQGATLYPNAEVEPSVAANPANPDNLVGVWQQDVYASRSARGAVAAYSLDGGQRWSLVPLPFTGCGPSPLLEPSTGRPYDAVYDNWISIGPDGTAYTTALAGNSTTYSDAVLAATSRDGGRTWANAQTVIESVQGASGQSRVFNDKAAVTAHPAIPGTAYLVWDQLTSHKTFPINTKNGRGPTYFSSTVDGGVSWSAPRAIYDPGEQNQTIGNQIVVVGGILYDFFALLTSTGSTSPGGGTASQVGFITSTDNGVSWSGVHIVADLQSSGVTDPNTGAAVTTGSLVSVAPAWDPVTGSLDVVWQDARFSGGRYDEIALSSSSDRGSTWTPPTRVNTATGRAAFDPSIAVRTDGTVAVTYYDLRALAPGNTTTLPTGYWLKALPPGAQGFGPDVAIWPADRPFNLMAAPTVAGGYFLGDYQGLAATGTSFATLFVAGTCGDSSCAGGANPVDVYAVTP